MNRMYRYTRHVYDASRRYYLLGRDSLIDQIAAQENGAVLEVGCGTARNLIELHQRAPHLALYGVDAAEVMLDTARRSVAQAGGSASIRLAQGLAQTWNPASAFGRTAPFDAVFFSYVLSMIPDWRAALDAALLHLKPGGRLYIVDFWDQANLPGWFAAGLRRWLALFGVVHRPRLHAFLRERAKREGGALTIAPVARRYAYVAVLQRAPAHEHAAAPEPANDSIIKS
ncbi:MAG: methyltransferase domain-containing protein [Bacteroidetes bacterium]|nr:methyltransferase domain-containing protein [Bacteroidota bacterium]